MPSHPPDNQFYKANPRAHTLWRDVSRLFEDYSGDNEEEFPQRQIEFERVLKDTLHRLDRARAKRHADTA